ncbi:hypothetical protein BLNAU_11126 [Blattamonas nauphoetae]|uniref:Uncharacterized protein n=1 Tax=Blattamonas nauphoetae TaxID=2049346 RepID=A0ABQ9XPA0_9EUKA|nr:hypothetical protein BLNAU_11126 [Blattamonas nauphoetae]
MSERTYLSPPSIISSPVDYGDNDIVNTVLSEEIPTESLAPHLRQFETNEKGLSWTRLMEWFVEAVIGADIFRRERPSAPPLTFENIRIDASSTIIIAFPSSPQQPSKAGSLSSDISTLCQFFLHIHRTLKQHNRLILPLDYKQEDIVFARIMVALVEHFVASGDLILPHSSPTDLFQYFVNCFVCIDKTRTPSANPFFIKNIAAVFAFVILLPKNRQHCRPTVHSFLLGDHVELSEQLLDAVKKVKETHSMEKVQNSYFDWKEWVTMMETIEQDVTRENNLSILQSRCLRATLLSLQTKHQLRANTTSIYETSRTVFSSDDSPTRTPRLPFYPDESINATDVSSSLLYSFISTQISLPSSQWSSNSRTVASEQACFHTDSIVCHSQQVLLTLHTILTRPHPTSFSWNNRPSFTPESVLDAYVNQFPDFFDLNEIFDISLFDDTDDRKVVASLNRCHAVLNATQSTKCIADVDNFQLLLLSGLRSSNHAVQIKCFNLFFEIGTVLQIAHDPREQRFEDLRMAFRDGTLWEKITLLKLWARWFFVTTRIGNAKPMNEADFDFDGFLAADVSDIRLFDHASQFLANLLFCDATSISLKWKLDFVFQFEKRNQMMSRLSIDPSSSSEQKRSRHFQSSLAYTLGSILSIYCGCDFPSELTELITIDLNLSPQNLWNRVNPAFFLNHTSIAPKSRHSFFPMDLMFERTLRDDPDAFFERQADLDFCTSRAFLHTPNVGLHSLLLRCPTLNLDQHSLFHLLLILFLDIDLDSTPDDLRTLFGYFPPPRLFDTLLSSPRLVRTTFDIWVHFLIIFVGFGVLTAPFGACSSLAKVFKLLAPFDSNQDQDELNVLSQAEEIVVSLHWLSIPSHFDSPLLCHLPSLAGAQRDVLQTLCSHSGIPSLFKPNTFNSHSGISSLVIPQLPLRERLRLLSQCVHQMASVGFRTSNIAVIIVEFLTTSLLSPYPAVVSVTLEIFHRFVSISSDAVRMLLVRKGLLDRVVLAVSNSSFLDDYEKGIAVIGILLSTIRRAHQTNTMRTFDFSRG